jgi:hypothetical protein
MPRRRARGKGLQTSLEEALSTLERTGQPVPVRRDGTVVAALVSLEDLGDQLGSSELSITDRRPLESAGTSPSRTLEALRELRDLAFDAD